MLKVFWWDTDNKIIQLLSGRNFIPPTKYDSWFNLQETRCSEITCPRSLVPSGPLFCW